MKHLKFALIAAVCLFSLLALVYSLIFGAQEATALNETLAKIVLWSFGALIFLLGIRY